jgi:hypothetical protein
MRSVAGYVVSAVGCSIVLSGCAGLDVRRVTSANQEGIRYWRPAHFLALHQTTDKDGKSSCDVNVLTLPDKSEEYAITFSPGMGSANVTPTLFEGWRLDSLSANIDSKTADNLNAIANLAKVAIPGGLFAPQSAPGPRRAAPTPEPCSGIFRVDYGPSGQVTGLTQVHMTAL